MRIGLLTAGGDCPGLNAVVRAVTKTLVLGYGAEVVGFEDGYLGMIEGRHRPLTLRDVGGLLDEGGTVLGTSNKANPFSFQGADVSDDVVRLYGDLALEGLVVVGGDGSMSIADGLQNKGLRIVGVPKTIDNDLAGTDLTFGFDTAVSIATEALDRLHTTAQSHHRVMILETMGRYAGWIALHAGVASGSDVILLPELPYDVEEVARVCRQREADGRRFTIVAMAEGAKPIGGEMTVQKVVADSPDPLRLGGACQVLGAQLEARVGSEVRTTILGHIQRGGPPSAFDRVLATRFGTHAAGLAAAGRWGVMAALRDGRLTETPFVEVANRTRTVAPDDLLVQAALAIGTSFGTAMLDDVPAA